MFKFMKSKKGFTLVELMIVVVIMAILVVVAVPIYNSVTDNAREKTCLDNQRQILSTVGNLYMMEGVTGNGTATLTFHGNTITPANLDTFSELVEIDDIEASFQTVPVCGAEENYLVATLSENTQGGTALISVKCCSDAAGTTATDHVLVDED
ncbi:MAG: type II secretion system protein [Ruminococcaceae bacterium]|nr:type II secretion system protein [Oscillospiraceae bacterium]